MALHSLAISELYDLDALEDQLKENQLLYELGDRPEEECRRRKKNLRGRSRSLARFTSSSRAAV
jgi:hypothetical protein